MDKDAAHELQDLHKDKGVLNCGLAILQSSLEMIGRGDGTSFDLPSVVAALGVLSGELSVQTIPDIVAEEALRQKEALELLKPFDALLQKQCRQSWSFVSMLEMAKGRLERSAFSSPLKKKEIAPRIPAYKGASLMRGEVFFLAKKMGLSAQERARACRIALYYSLSNPVVEGQGEEKEKLAFLSAFGRLAIGAIAHGVVSPPFRFSDGEFILKAHVVRAAKDISKLLISNNFALEGVGTHMPSVILSAGGLLGEALHQIACDPQTPWRKPQFVLEDFLDSRREMGLFLRQAHAMFGRDDDLEVQKEGGPSYDALVRKVFEGYDAETGEWTLPLGKGMTVNRSPQLEAALSRREVEAIEEHCALSPWEKAAARCCAIGILLQSGKSVQFNPVLGFSMALGTAVMATVSGPVDFQDVMDGVPDVELWGNLKTMQKRVQGLSLS